MANDQILTPNGNPIVSRWSKVYNCAPLLGEPADEVVRSVIEELSDMTADWQRANEAITVVERERDAASSS